MFMLRSTYGREIAEYNERWDLLWDSCIVQQRRIAELEKQLKTRDNVKRKAKGKKTFSKG